MINIEAIRKHMNETREEHAGTAYSYTVNDANILTVTVATNCPQGGDSGHGGRTYFALKNEGCTDMMLKVNGKWVEVNSVELLFGGDAEYSTLKQCLSAALYFLSEARGSEISTKRVNNIEAIDIGK